MNRLALVLLLAAVPLRADDLPPYLVKAVDAMQHNDFRKAIPLFDAGLAEARKEGREWRAAYCLYMAGAALRLSGSLEEGLSRQRLAQPLFERAGDKELDANSRREIAQGLTALRRYPEALSVWKDVLRLDGETENDAGARDDWASLAQTQSAAGDAAAALKSYERSLALIPETDRMRQGGARLAIAALYDKLRDPSRAAAERTAGARLQSEAKEAVQRKNGAWEVDQHFNTASQRESVGDFRGAYRAWEAMLAEARKRGFKNGMTIPLMRMAGMDSEWGRHKQAIAEAEEGARIAAEDEEPVNEISLLRIAGIAHLNSGNFEKALVFLKSSRAAAVRHRRASEELESLKALRLAYGILADFKAMISCNAQMLEVARRSGRKRDRIKALDFVGRFHEEIGDHETARGHYEQALALAKQVGDREVVADMLNDVGCGDMETGRYDEGIAAFEQSLAIHEWPGVHVNIVEDYLRSGREEKAYSILNPADPKHILIGRYALFKKDYARARDLYAHHVPIAAKEKRILSVIPVETGLGLSYEGLKEYDKAEEHYRRAEELIDRLRDTLSPAHRLFFLADLDWTMPHLEPFEGMVRISEFRPGGIREALHHAEFTRGRLFTEAAARRYGLPGTALPPDLEAREKSLDRATAVAAAKAEAAFRSDRMDEYGALEKDLLAVKRRRREFAEALRGGYPEYAAVRYPQPLYAEQFALRPGEVLVEFEVTEPYSKAFVVKDGKVALSYDIPLPRRELAALVRRYRGYFEGVSTAEQLAAYDPELGRRLYSLLLEKALSAKDEGGKPLVPADSLITIVPDEILGILPFESLVVSTRGRAQMPSGRFGPAPAGVTYVADEYDVAYQHSGTAMTVQRSLKTKEPPVRPLFVLADPVFNAADSRLRGEKPAGTLAAPATAEAVLKTMGLAGGRGGSAAERVVGADKFAFPRLDKTGQLALDLRDGVFDAASADLMTGLDANKRALLRKDLSGYRYLVFATHGILDDAVAGLREPALVLNQLGEGADGGFLTQTEVMDLKLNADLVALTACQTGLGRQLTGEGVMGLGRAFQYAGARSVVVSLWSVAEDSTSMLAKSLFRHLKDGKTKRQALRLARAEVRHAGYEHPFYWAPFILIGD